MEGKMKRLIAHRGASAYAPEHTLAAYQLALEQGADFVEQDLQITRDGVLVCLHDETLERTTNVEELFPDRFREAEDRRGQKRSRWYVHEFTLQEIKTLDAGSWFSPEFAGAQVPTWQEAVDLLKGRAGLFPELKSPEIHRERGISMEELVLEHLRSNGLDQPGADPETPVILQTFDETAARTLSLELKTELPVVLLFGDPKHRLLTPGGLAELSGFATGIGPFKEILRADPEIVRNAHTLGLSVTPYTFRARQVGSGFSTVSEEMSFYLFEIGVDALFTDNPDLFPRDVPHR